VRRGVEGEWEDPQRAGAPRLVHGPAHDRLRAPVFAGHHEEHGRKHGVLDVRSGPPGAVGDVGGRDEEPGALVNAAREEERRAEDKLADQPRVATGRPDQRLAS
jgi:hypothetical protein